MWWGCCRPKGIPPFHLTRGVLVRQSACEEQWGGSPQTPTRLIRTERGVLSGYGMVRIKGGWGASLGNRGMSCAPARPTGKNHTKAPSCRDSAPPAGDHWTSQLLGSGFGCPTTAAGTAALGPADTRPTSATILPVPIAPHQGPLLPEVGGPKRSRPTVACAPPQGDKHP